MVTNQSTDGQSLSLHQAQSQREGKKDENTQPCRPIFDLDSINLHEFHHYAASPCSIFKVGLAVIILGSIGRLYYVTQWPPMCKLSEARAYQIDHRRHWLEYLWRDTENLKSTLEIMACYNKKLFSQPYMDKDFSNIKGSLRLIAQHCDHMDHSKWDWDRIDIRIDDRLRAINCPSSR